MVNRPGLESVCSRSFFLDGRSFSNFERDLMALDLNHGVNVRAISSRRRLTAKLHAAFAPTAGQLVYHKNGKLVSIEGDPASPISRGHLCPKGANTHQLHSHPGRLTKVKYRRPYERDWEELDLDSAMQMIAERVWETRERTFEETRNGELLMRTTAFAHLGGATLDNEENYLIKKLFTGGLGMVCISNQARI